MNTYKYIFGVMAGSVLLTSACTDFSDYNDAYIDGSEAGINAGKTLWENISSDVDLSEFAELVQKGGYADKLSESQSYTIWAPVNGTFDISEYASMTQDTLVSHFLNNHIMRGNTQLSGSINKRVHTLNEKAYMVEGAGDNYMFGDQKVLSANNVSSTGTIHKIDGAQPFRPNVYEFVFETQDVDSVSKYFRRAEERKLDENESVEGPIVDGQQTFLDSVIVINYPLFDDYLNAKPLNEDSSYTMLLPNNSAYIKSYDRIRPYFNYVSKTHYSVISSTSSSVSTTATSYTLDDPVTLGDSITRMQMFYNMIFSNNDTYNKEGYPDNIVAPDDTIRTTTNNKLSNVSDLLGYTVNNDSKKVSNGYVRIVDSLAYLPWETWCPEIFVTGSEASVNCVVKNDNDFEYTNPETKATEVVRYVSYTQTGRTGLQAYYLLPDVCSAAYNIYCLMVAPTVGSKNTGEELQEEMLENKITFNLEHSTATGTKASASFSDKLTTFYKTLEDGTKATDKEIDTVLVTDEPVTFNVSYYGRGSEVCPYLRVQNARKSYGSDLTTFGANMRIIGILLRPAEYDEYLKKAE